MQPLCQISKWFYGESTPNDYVRSVPSHRKTRSFFQPKRAVTKSTTRENESLPFDDLHQMTLIGLHVTQYMYVLFDKVHIFQRISVYISALCSVVQKHPVILQRATSIYRNTHHKC